MEKTKETVKAINVGQNKELHECWCSELEFHLVSKRKTLSNMITSKLQNKMGVEDEER